MFGFLDFSNEKEFAKDLSGKITKEIPPNIFSANKKIISVNRLTKVLENAFSTAENYKNKKRVGFARRAVILNYFKWELKEAGYSVDFINMAVEGALISLMKKK